MMGRKRDAKILLDAFEQALKSGDFTNNGEEYVISCPFCDDHQGNFYLNVSKKIGHCFRARCEVGVSFKSQLVGHSVRGYLQTNLPSISSPKNIQEVDVNYPLVPIMSAKGEHRIWALKTSIGRVYDYCITRGMTHKQIADYKVSAKPFESRAYFPYWDSQGDIVFWMGRALGNQMPKTTEKRGTSKPLYGRHVKKWGSDESIVLVEGVFDHFATIGSYALMGSSISTEQVRGLLRDDIGRVFVIGDPDADSSVQRICGKLLKSCILAYPVQLAGTDKDPAELGPKIMGKVVSELTALPTMRRSQQLRVDVATMEKGLGQHL